MNYWDDAIRLPYTADQVAWSRERLREVRAGRGDGLYEGRDAHLGFLFERLVVSWLESEQGIPCRWNGGNEGRPDIEIGSHGLAAKARIADLSRVREPMLLVPAKQEMPEMIALGVVDIGGSSLAWLLGVIPRSVYLRVSLPVAEGEELWPGWKSRTAVRVVPRESLSSPIGWLQEIYVSELQFA